MKESLTEQFEKNGYIVVPKVLSAERLDTMRSYILDMYHERQKSHTGRYHVSKDANTLKDCIDDCHVDYPELLETICNPVLINPLKMVLGENFLVMPGSSLMINRYNTLHTDTTSPEMLGWNFHKDPEFRIVTIGLYLQDSHVAGGLRVAPGSHLFSDPLIADDRRKKMLRESRLKRKIHKLSGKKIYGPSARMKKVTQDLYDIPSKAGDAVIFDMRLIHVASPIAGKRPPVDRVAIFSRCSRNNACAHAYTDYLKSIEGYGFMKKQRDLSCLNQELAKYNVSSL